MKQSLTKIKVAIVVVATIMLTACSSKYEKTASGMAYKITRGKGKDTLRSGEWIQFNIEFKVGKKDSVLFSTYKKTPEFLPLDFTKINAYDFSELLPKLHEGDKAEFVMSIDTLVKMKKLEYNPLFLKGETIKGKLEVVKVYANETACKPDREATMVKARELQMKEMEKQMKEMKEKAAQDLKDYLTKNKAAFDKQVTELKEYALKNNIKTVQSPLGTLVEIATEGTGAKPVDGKHAQVMYRGYLVNGKVFDANMGIDARHKEPIDVVFGQGGTIPGFEDGLKYFSKGAKGRILIPAALAYRDQANQEIPANSSLIFDIEVLDVSDTAPAPAQAPVKVEEPKKN